MADWKGWILDRKRHQLIERRKIVGLSQEGLAEAVGVDRSTAARWERGETTPQPWHRPRLAEVLKVSVEEIDALLADSEDVLVTVPAGRQEETTRVALVLGHRTRAGLMPLPGDKAYASALQSFRVADRQIGGRHLYATVVGFLHREVAPDLFRAYGTSDRGAFTAAAALTEMAGWMAHDAGHDDAARQHFVRAYDLAQLGTDRQLAAHILASMSHLEHHLGQPERGINLARRGHAGLSAAPRQPELEARLMALEARGLAAQGQSQACVQLLGRAEATLASPPDEPVSPWVSRFDEAALANDTARSLRHLGDLSAAGRHAERVLALRPDDRPRSRAFGQLILVAVLLARGQLEEACAAAGEVVAATHHLGSYLVVRQLGNVRRRLAAHKGQSVVSAFMEDLDEALWDRRWLHPGDEQWQPAFAAGPR